MTILPCITKWPLVHHIYKNRSDPSFLDYPKTEQYFKRHRKSTMHCRTAAIYHAIWKIIVFLYEKKCENTHFLLFVIASHQLGQITTIVRNDGL